MYVWNVEKLRKYSKDRGIVITGDTRKPDLISKVYYAFRLHMICNCVAPDSNLQQEERKGS